jgi:hypothetical protein
LTFSKDYVRLNIMGLPRLQDALERLTTAIHDVETEVTAMKAEHDPRWRHTFSFHAAIIGTPRTQKGESVAR